MNTTFVTNPKGIDQNIYKDETRRLNSVYTLLGVTIIVLALLTASISFIILIGLTPIVPNRAVTLFFIAINSIWILGLIVIVLYEVIPII
ncbi:MAG: PAS domain-containing sensor histidine kinase, partial [Bartonella sp.]|nr:PAS domain-containing sensor histidine kinase [Bartonella sp.]